MVQQSTFFATVSVESSDSYSTDSDGDLWPSCWADDGNLYAANGDGRGFSDQPSSDLVMNRVTGSPTDPGGITGERLAIGYEIANIWADPSKYNRKPTGMVCVDGVIYVAVQDLSKPPCPACFDDAPNASISKSEDHGKTWQKTSVPMFTHYRFTTIFFLDFGKNYENAKGALGEAGSRYVYPYGLDWNWRDSFSDTVRDPTSLYLARVPRTSIQDRSKWEFYTGPGANGNPKWDSDIELKSPVLQDEQRQYQTLRDKDRHAHNLTRLSQGSVVYNEPLDRYIYTSWTEYTFEFYEAPKPWGPWKHFITKDFGGYPWHGDQDGDRGRSAKKGGYATTIPSKFISADGRTMWVQSNWFVGAVGDEANYNFSLRRLTVEPFISMKPSNAPEPTNNLARTGEGTTALEKSTHFGSHSYSYSESGPKQSEDSFDGENKQVDFWGYTWKRAYRLDRIVYTTGEMFSDGGWFSRFDGGLRVQVRQDFNWIDVGNLSSDPRYPYNETAGPYKAYILAFDETWGDGVRIIGSPGGSAYFTSISELEVYYHG